MTKDELRKALSEAERARRPAPREQPGERARVENVGGRGAAAPRGPDRVAHVLEPRRRVRVGRARDPHAGRDRVAHVLAASGRAGRAARSPRARRPRSRAPRRPLEVERVRRPVADQPPGRMAQAETSGAASPTHPLRQLGAAASAGRRARRPAPSRARPARRPAGRATPSARMSHSIPRRTPERRQHARSRRRSPRPAGGAASASSPCTTRTAGVWSQIARYS